MGSPLSPVTANLFMEEFEKKALATSTLKLGFWFRCVDDTLSSWAHGLENLHPFLEHINSLHPIKFILEMQKEDKTIPSLDVLLIIQEDGSLGHKVYRKPTHTDRYLHYNSVKSPTRGQRILDIFLTNVPHFWKKTNVEKSLVRSDHNMVLV